MTKKPTLFTNKLANAVLSKAILVAFLLCSIPAHAQNRFVELEKNLQKKEAEIYNLQPDTEKIIRWYQSERSIRPLAFVYLHGFSATRQELSPVTENLADHMCANVFYTRLKGHGRDANAMAEAQVSDWYQDALEALSTAEKIGRKVVLISTSTGSTLAAWLQLHAPNAPIVASIQVSPNYGVKSKLARFMRYKWVMSISKWINGDYYSFEPVNAVQAQYWTERYPLEAIVPMIELVNEIDRADLGKIDVPQLIVYSPDDQVVNIDKVLAAAQRYNNARTQAFTKSSAKSQHVLAGRATAPDAVAPMVSLMSDFLQKAGLQGCAG